MRRNAMNLRKLLLIHAIVTLAAAVVLVVAPAAIPATVNVPLLPEQYLLCYFLAAAELAIAFLSFAGRNLQDKQATRLIVQSFILFHAATGLLESYALLQGISSKIIANIGLRVVIVLLFYRYGALGKSVPTEKF